MTAELFDLASWRAARPEPSRAQISVEEGEESCLPIISRRDRPLPPPATITAKNSRLRATRVEAWHRADATTRYWRALVDFIDTVSIAQRWCVKESARHDASNELRLAALDSYRAALVRQFLTPAPTVEKVNWKRQQLKHAYIDDAGKREIAKVIAKDAAFLEAHPTRKSRVKPAD